MSNSNFVVPFVSLFRNKVQFSQTLLLKYNSSTETKCNLDFRLVGVKEFFPSDV